MVGGREVLGEVIGMVAASAFPVDAELPLPYSVSDPVEAHVHGFGALCFYGVVGDAGCYLVVSLDGRWAWLGCPISSSMVRIATPSWPLW